MREAGVILDPHTVRFERVLPCPAERAWEFLTRSDLLARWLAPGEVEPRVGGRVLLRFDVGEAPERTQAGAAIRGEVSRCEPPHALAYSWVDVPPPGARAGSAVPDSHVTFELAPRGEQTRLALTHRGLPTGLLASCLAGWHTHLGVLLARIEGLTPLPFLPVFQRLLPAYAKVTAAQCDSAEPHA